MKIAQKKYTHKSKLSTLRILEKNDFNYLKTEKLTGVNRSTLKKWEAAFGNEVFSGKSPGEIALKEVDAEIKRNDIKVITKYYNIRMQLLDRIIQLIPSETRLDPLVNTLKSISEEIELLDDHDKTNNRSHIEFIQNISAQLKTKLHGDQELNNNKKQN